MDSVSRFFAHFTEPNFQTALLVVLNLIVIESLLSIDNAAVLATMVMHLKTNQRKRALRIGVVFAYIFRGTALIFASYLIQINWLKFAGGGYLLFLAVQFFYNRYFTGDSDDEQLKKRADRKLPFLNIFWSAVVMVELMDLTFSIDNVFAAVAYTDNIYLICTGVFIGIVTMRIVAGYFVGIMERFPFLETVAFLVVGLLGARLCMEFMCTYSTSNFICTWLHSKRIDMYFSMITLGVFFIPIATSLLFGFPGKKNR